MTPPSAPHTRLILFCKYPVPGQVKTRLLSLLTAEQAADLQRELLCRIAHEIRQVVAQVPGVVAEIRISGGSQPQFTALLGNHFSYAPQGPRDLGARMERAMAQAFQDGMGQAVIVGADVPLLNAHIISKSIVALQQSDAVIGPAEDGGYYLIGLRKPLPQLFSSMPWGTETVLTETMERLKESKISVFTLPTLYDIDRPADLLRWKAM